MMAVRTRTRPSPKPTSEPPAPATSHIAAQSAAPQSSPCKGASRRPVDSPEPYTVGYAKPPKQHQFQKGQSGNPKGRPAKSVSMQATLSKVLGEEITANLNGERRTMSHLEAVLRMALQLSLKGNLTSAALILKYAATLSAPADPHASTQQSATVGFSEEERRVLREHLKSLHLDR